LLKPRIPGSLLYRSRFKEQEEEEEEPRPVLQGMPPGELEEDPEPGVHDLSQ
jgi:hypothetical protein|tara:strand:+ start:225 stop:380 length:156 start_codon:yes stop_codon:yes gene_type:complete